MKDSFLIFVPGIMGTSLTYVGEGKYRALERIRVWSDDLTALWDALANNPSLLTQDKLEVGEVLREIRLVAFGRFKPVYGPLLNFLTDPDGELRYKEGSNFCSFGYDWRRDNRETASELADFMRSKLASGVSSFTLLAHSMGGIIVRLLLSEYRELAEKIDLYIQIATPVRGASKACYTLKREPDFGPLANRLLRWWQLLHQSVRNDLLESLRLFPSLYQLLPPEGEDILATASGEHFNALDRKVWNQAYHASLIKAHAVHRVIQSCNFARIVTIYGAGIITPREYLIDQFFQILKKLPSSLLGDGTVTIASAVHDSPLASRLPIPNGGAEHDRLPNQRVVFDRIAEELKR
jgi:pimeloyl-ACP methyl ester carboxylesterase